MKKYKEYWKCVWSDKETVSGSGFTIDKVYERINGVLVDDDGFCWKKHPLNINNVNFVQVEQDSQVEVHSGIGDTLYLAVHVGNDRTFIKYGNNNDKIEKVINREVTEHELLAILDKLEGNKQNLVNMPKGEDYGTVGEGTGLKDSLGVDLFVGDVVKIYKNGVHISTSFVVEHDRKCFIMGLKYYNDSFKVQKIKNYWDLKDGEQYNLIRVHK